ncbi:type II toxin-antitoxin system HicA family toxin [Methylobacterium sp. JK268]
MPKVETSRRSVVDRLLAEGWLDEGGTKHAKFGHPNRPGVKIMVPRHPQLSPGVARNIAKAAGWI